VSDLDHLCDAVEELNDKQRRNLSLDDREEEQLVPVIIKCVKQRSYIVYKTNVIKKTH
jgi:hypothetical protein